MFHLCSALKCIIFSWFLFFSPDLIAIMFKSWLWVVFPPTKTGRSWKTFLFTSGLGGKPKKNYPITILYTYMCTCASEGISNKLDHSMMFFQFYTWFSLSLLIDSFIEPLRQGIYHGWIIKKKKKKEKTAVISKGMLS